MLDALLAVVLIVQLAGTVALWRATEADRRWLREQEDRE